MNENKTPFSPWIETSETNQQPQPTQQQMQPQQNTTTSNLLDKLEPIPSGRLNIDVKKFEGTKAKIEKIEVIDSFTSFDEDGNFVEGLKRPVKKLRISTEPLEIIDSPTGPVEIRASMLFNLKPKKDANGNIVGWGWSTDPNAKLNRFLKKMRVNNPKELIGKYVIVVTRPSNRPDDDREFLGFVI